MRGRSDFSYAVLRRVRLKLQLIARERNERITTRLLYVAEYVIEFYTHVRRDRAERISF